MTESVPWPWPGDTELEKRERIARDYRKALRQVDPELCGALDTAARRLGQHWITPEPVLYNMDDWITISQAAELVRRTPRAVRYWISGDSPRLNAITDKQGIKRVCVQDLLDVEADLRAQRAERTT